MSREQVFVTGHRNPDMDSVCSSWAYAKLKNMVDPTRNYIPIRGHMNDITNAQFSRLGIKAPMYVNDIKPRVYDVILKCEELHQLDDPLFNICNYFNKKNYSVIPVFQGEKYCGMLPIEAITNYLLKKSSVARPKYKFYIHNFPKLIKGRFLKVGEQTEFISTIVIGLKKFEQFQSTMKQHRKHLPLVILGNRKRHIELAMEMNVPAIIIVCNESDRSLQIDTSNYKGTIFISEIESEQTLQYLKMSIPLKNLMGQEQPPPVSPTDYFDDVKQLFTSTTFRAFPVLNEEGDFYGIVQKSSFLVRPKKKVILVDHNEPSQYISGLEDAEIIEIIDHHRLAAEKTSTPIFIDAEPLGSTCTIVYNLYRKYDQELDQETALVLLSGLISDTVMLKSPTTTLIDQEVAAKLTRIAGIQSLQNFGETMFSGGASITTQDARKLITSDFKIFSEYGTKFGIGQCEVTQFQGIDEIKEHWLEVLEQVKQENKLDWAMIVITNIIKEDSIMLMTPYPEKEKKLKYERQSNQEYLCPGVLSRKIQILPEIIRVLSDVD
ncbi:putative manganese-dependent inorganic diphosphatase [Histomonas meleagridis]|uniref:putative manganese-dependent inorganic diphosphatase n=1 Tax=Histomonas meleagridis TaxID=135588 RepID=UPI00355A5E75|nr:putative manganese-dependent inorganic diphosphatase [Histomonas meleagridis]KAH0797171.1 putative manganese-dependent inorganic diphosphatase [Histomonas meleagridis]